MSKHAPDRRECRECGARLSSWYCDVCGGFTLKAVARVSVAELTLPRSGAALDSRARGPVRAALS